MELTKEQKQCEEMLLETISKVPKEIATFILQDYVQRFGPVSDEIGDKIKKTLESK